MLSKEELAAGVKLKATLQQLEQAANSDPGKQWMVPSIRAAQAELQKELASS